MRDWLQYLGGAWCPAQSGAWLEVVDPASEEVFARIPRGGAADVASAVAAANAALRGPWSQLKPKQRARMLYDLARALEAEADTFAELETRDAGKPLALARKEVLGTARYFEYYAGAADKLQGDTIPLGPDYLDFTLREPVGVTVHILPWNMPLNMVGRSVAPALAAGNTAVVKPSEFTSLTALKLAELFERLDFPAGVYNVVTGTGPEVGEALVGHPEIDAITFTGSVATGRQIMRTAANHVVPLVLELGGKSPHLIFADADLDLAAAEALRAIVTNCGQICSAGSRLLVERSIAEPLLARMLERVAALRIGPGAENPDIGPLVSAVHHQRVLSHIRAGQAAGARLRYGGDSPRPRGYFVSPTIFDRVDPAAPLAQEEIFGPVLAVFDFADEAEALALANGVRYGLVAGIFTRDIDRALRLARGLRGGQIYINEYFAGGEETPFGGTKLSGFGREKGLAALSHYTQLKNIAIRIRS